MIRSREPHQQTSYLSVTDSTVTEYDSLDHYKASYYFLTFRMLSSGIYTIIIVFKFNCYRYILIDFCSRHIELLHTLSPFNYIITYQRNFSAILPCLVVAMFGKLKLFDRWQYKTNYDALNNNGIGN